MNVKEMLTQAKNERYAIGAFNAANIESLKAITNAAYKLNAPVIIEASKGEVDYIGKNQLFDLVENYRKVLGIKIILNLDHAESLKECEEALSAGFDYIHFDGSKLPLEENIKVTKEVVELCHLRNVPVEGEMDHIQGSSADHTQESPNSFQNPQQYTNPQAARDFVEKTGIDTFAAFFGNLHGLYSREIHLDLNLLYQIRDFLPNTFLSLHGGSGIADNEVKKAIEIGGIVKININSELRVAFKNTLQKTLDNTDEVAIYKITPEAILAVQEIVEHKIKLFGSAGKA